MGLDPGTPGSCPELKADAQPLNHPGIPPSGDIWKHCQLSTLGRAVATCIQWVKVSDVLNILHAQDSPSMTKNALAPNGNGTEVENASLYVCKDSACFRGVHPKLISRDTGNGDWIGGGHQNLTSQGLFLSLSLYKQDVLMHCVTKTYVLKNPTKQYQMYPNQPKKQNSFL